MSKYLTDEELLEIKKSRYEFDKYSDSDYIRLYNEYEECLLSVENFENPVFKTEELSLFSEKCVSAYFRELDEAMNS